MFSPEALNPTYMKQNGAGKRFRRMFGSWSPVELRRFIEYKAEGTGKTTVYINPKYTLQKCSKCGYVDKNNRHGSFSNVVIVDSN